MSRRRTTILISLAGLTLIFLGAAAYTFYGNPFPKNEPLSVKPLPLDEAPTAIRLTVHESGIAAITASELRDTNLPFQDFDTDSLRLLRDGRDVPFHLAGEGRDATLYFYAQAVTNTLDAPAVYWLEPGPGTAMRRQASAPAETGSSLGWQRLHWEENTTFLALATGEDIWLGQFLFAPTSFDLMLDNVQSSGGPGELTIHLWSNNEALPRPDHHVEILLNGVKLTDHFWDGIKEQTIPITLPPDTLQMGHNTLTINVPGDTGAAGEAIYLDWVSLNYESELHTGRGQLQFTTSNESLVVSTNDPESMVFNITNPDDPVYLTDTQYEDGELRFAGSRLDEDETFLVLDSSQVIEPRLDLVPEWEPLKTAERGADYIAILANVEGFSEALQPLLDYRREQGLRVEEISADQIYDEFAYGRQTPAAIRDFLAYANEEWAEPAPQFVLLVGDASYDLYEFLGGKNKNLLPTYLVYTEFAGYVASDTWFTIFDEAVPAPSLAVGRLPAQTVDQLESMVQKTIEYESEADADWVNRALLVADDEPRFDEASDDLNDDLSAMGYETQKLYMTEKEDIHDAIISALNQGVGILNYVGHGGVAVWGDELVLQSEDADILVNGSRLPIFTTFTCLNGYFNHPTTDALAETLLWAENGGVVAAVAPSGRSFTHQQTPLADAFYSALLTGEAKTIGEALQSAKVLAANDEDLAEVIHTFNLLGDPALHFNMP